jgi:lipoprotein-anchoring transpeptidase ErfK/SrfK
MSLASWLRCSLIVVGFAAHNDRALAREMVNFSSKESPGTIVVRTNERRLYLIVNEGRALRYAVGVGRAGKQWFGSTTIVSKHIKPSWSPPAELRRGRPAWVIPAGAPNNPMGAAALVLADNELAIHGTNNPGSVGGFVSAGCIRMRNEDIMDLYDRVRVGTRVVLTDALRAENKPIPAQQTPSGRSATSPTDGVAAAPDALPGSPAPLPWDIFD